MHKNNHKANGTAKTAPPAPTPPPPQASPLASPPPQQRITLGDLEVRLSPRDVWIIANGVRMTPWGGGEERVTSLHRIYTALRLAKVNTSAQMCPPADARPIEIVKMPAQDVELVIRVLCGEGDKAFSGEAGPTMSDLVIRLREQVKAAVRAAVAKQVAKQPAKA